MSDFHIDRRFDKPGHESLVDLINDSNKTYIKPGEIEGDQITAVEGLPLGLNTSVRIRLKGAKEGAPSSTLFYRRLDIGKYLADRGPFPYDLEREDKDQQEILDAIKAQYGVELSLEDVGIIYKWTDTAQYVILVMYSRNPVFYGEVRLQGKPPSDLSWVVDEIMRDLTLADVMTGTEIIPAIQDVIPKQMRKLRITDVKL